jgi:hypothetical protein
MALASWHGCFFKPFCVPANQQHLFPAKNWRYKLSHRYADVKVISLDVDLPDHAGFDLPAPICAKAPHSAAKTQKGLQIVSP